MLRHAMSLTERSIKRAVLVVLDGFGERAERDANAIRLAHTPRLDALRAQFPSTLIETSGTAVGLPAGQMGNSEVGHMNLGAGRIVYQDLTRIDAAIADGSFFDNAVLVDAIETARTRGGKLHLMGLTSDGGVHASIDHAVALCELAQRRGLGRGRVHWHAFLDGRDTPPRSAAATLRALEARLATQGTAQLASLCGRYYAMDRDQRWDRVALAYDLLTQGTAAHRGTDAAAAIEAAYERGEGDEFIKPIVLVDTADRPRAKIVDDDVVIFFNFRADRARQLSAALTHDGFDAFPRAKQPKLARFVCMGRYDHQLALPVAFPPQSLEMGLGEYLASLGLRQLRTAETEKYAHVTFFFNGGREQPFDGEERRLVPSRRDIATYDLAPAMSADAVADGVVEAIVSERFALVLVNFANPDMVGHTGILPAAIDAVTTIDACLGRIADAALAHDTVVLITADHGNCEQMVDETGQPHTQHTTNPVPLLIVDPRQAGRSIVDGGRLCDIAPTLLSLMGLPIPPLMTGKNLLP